MLLKCGRKTYAEMFILDGLGASLLGEGERMLCMLFGGVLFCLDVLPMWRLVGRMCD